MKIRVYFLPCLFLFAISFGIANTTAYSQEKDVVLAQGNPPLTQLMVDKTAGLLQWALEIQLSHEHKSMLQKVLVRAWQTKNKDEIQSTLGMIEIHDKVIQMSEADRNNARGRLQAAFLENFRKEPDDEMSKILVSAYEANHKNSSVNSSAGNNSKQNSNVSKSLVGKWDSYGNYTSYEFFPDGSYVYHAWVKMSNITCATTLITNISGEYSLQGGTLTLNPASGTNEYKYSCPTKTEKKTINDLQEKSLTVNFRRENNLEKACFTDGKKTESCYVKVQ
jgi:hypothetical protein